MLVRHRVGRTGSGSDDHLFVVLAAHRGTTAGFRLRRTARARNTCCGRRLRRRSVGSDGAVETRCHPRGRDDGRCSPRRSTGSDSRRGNGADRTGCPRRRHVHGPAARRRRRLPARRVCTGRADSSSHCRRSSQLPRRVDLNDSEVFLTAKEFDLLSFFSRHPDEVMSRERLLAEVWGWTLGSADTVTVHVRRLRSKIEADPSRPELIQTVWGIPVRDTRCPSGDRSCRAWTVAAAGNRARSELSPAANGGNGALRTVSGQGRSGRSPVSCPTYPR